MTAFDVTVDIAVLKKALTRVKPAFMSKTTLPVLRDGHLQVVGDTVVVTVTDLDKWLAAPIPAETSSPDGSAVLIGFAQLEKFCTQKKTGWLHIVGPSADNEKVTLEVGKTVIKLDVTPLSEYPQWPTRTGKAVRLNAAALADVLGAASTDDSRPILTGVHVHDGRYAATDSYRLYTVETGENVGAAATDDRQLLIPQSSVAVLVKNSGGADKYITGFVSDDVRDLDVKLSDGFHIRTRLIEGEFPNYKPLMLQDNTAVSVEWDNLSEVLVGVQEVIAMIKVIGGDSQPIRFETEDQDGSGDGSILPTTTGKLSLRSHKGEITQSFAGVVHTASAFNPSYLHQLLKGTTFTRLIGVDNLKPWMGVETVDSIAPGAVRRRLIMPVRI